MQYHYVLVVVLILCVCLVGQLLTEAAYVSSLWFSRTLRYRFAWWPRSSVLRSTIMCIGAVGAFFALTFAYHCSWRNAGGGLMGHDLEAVGLIEIGFSFLMGGSLISALSAVSYLRPKFADRLIPSNKREQAWCMLEIEAWAAVGIASFSSFTLIHEADLVRAGLNGWWIWTGFTLSGTIVATGVALFARLPRSSPSSK